MRKIWLNLSTAVMLSSVLWLAGCAANRAGGAQDNMVAGVDQPDNIKRAHIRMQLAAAYYQRGEMRVALDEVQRALQANPDSSDAYNMRGLIYMGMDETALADDSFKQALKLEPNNAEASNNYGWFLCQNGRANQSIAYFEAALKNRAYESPDKALNNAGVCSLKLHDSAAAERYFSRAFQIAPANPSANLNLAQLYYDRHDYERAHFYASRLLKEDVKTPEVLWLAIKIEHKRQDRMAESELAVQLHQRYPESAQFASYQRGVFDE